MEDDLYQYLIGGAPTQAQIPAIVDKLRRRRSLGELGSLTGDRVLSPFGQNMVKQADQYAGDLQDIRQKDIDNAQTQAYQTGQLEHMDSVLQATLARDRNNAEHQRRADEAAMLRAKAALARAEKAGAPKALTLPAIKLLNEKRQSTDKIAGLKSSFKPEYARMSTPGFRTLTNVGSRMGMGTKETKEAAEWWRQFQLDYNILARNEQFGATLNPNEKASWAQANAGAEMTADQINTILATMERWYSKDLNDLADTMEMSFDPTAVNQAAGRNYTPTPEGAAPPEALAELEAAIQAGDDAAVGEFVEEFGEEALPPYLRPAP